MMKNNEPRVKTTQELQSDFNKIDLMIEDYVRRRKEINESIKSARKQLKEIAELIENNNQINMFPND